MMGELIMGLRADGLTMFNLTFANTLLNLNSELPLLWLNTQWGRSSNNALLSQILLDLTAIGKKKSGTNLLIS